ncbi:inositol monophosphatase family protein [Aureibacter tunicatorum]|uniref:Fructose-1,6-bisphosphatase/inositol monophosphatase family enzyme n=1 Tax=Aureibacter tunicatorum TaxID=866807 RepID=A0AAE3XNZ8_9BACT|nr:inositol monophosphatase family protein [Aureibacter tunicatorum]MDR6239266.1 fructose-1,6-bisphosphatase/inositol monophosphatase family enzyme [Aureibacter tunicatorum]BDD04809.1 3'(2'),5'-bisphosphate nucleotidase CysQ [Aureibacter tunicatorum]
MLSIQDLSELNKIAIIAAEKASHIIQQNFGKIKVSHKASGSSEASQIVTEADLESEKIIIDTLKESIEFYNLGLLAEESTDNNSRFTKDYFWCIDPLDGTMQYSQGKSGYSISIALVERNGNPVLGVIKDPYFDKLYTYNTPIQSSSKEHESNTVTIITDNSFFKSSFSDRFKEAVKKSKHEIIMQNIGGAVLSAMHVLNTPNSIFVKFPKEETGGGCIWDYAASVFLFNKNNISPVNFDDLPIHLNPSESLYYNEKGVIFSNSYKLKKIAIESYQNHMTK